METPSCVVLPVWTVVHVHRRVCVNCRRSGWKDYTLAASVAFEEKCKQARYPLSVGGSNTHTLHRRL